MRHNDSLADRPLGAVLEAISSDDVSPGAGAAGAVGLALAAACAGKAVAITLKHRPDDEVLTQVRKELVAIVHRALHGADEDSAHFREFMRDKDAASAAELLDSGRRLQHLGRKLFALLEQLDNRIDNSVCADVLAARALCAAFSEIQSENLRENARQ